MGESREQRAVDTINPSVSPEGNLKSIKFVDFVSFLPLSLIYILDH